MLILSVNDVEAKDQLRTAPGETTVVTFSDGGSTPPASTMQIHNHLECELNVVMKSNDFLNVVVNKLLYSGKVNRNLQKRAWASMIVT